jgi:hypothetical protein
MSNIDPTVPIYENPTTASVRANFATAKSEIEVLQSDTVGAPFVPLAGDVMTGPLLLVGDPTQSAQAATKNYVDNKVAGGSGGSGGVPEAPEDSYTYGRINASWVHVLPIAGGVLTGLLTLSGPPTTALHAASKGYVDTMLPLAGGTLTGALTLSGAPTTALMAATKGYVDGAALPVAGGSLTGAIGFNISIAPPGTGALGTDGTRLQLYPRTVGTDPGIGIGVTSAAMFLAVRGAWDAFEFFANTAQIAILAGTGTLSLLNLLSVGSLSGVPANAGPAQVLAIGSGQALMLAGLINTTMAGNLYNSAGGMRYVSANPAAYFSVSHTDFAWATAPSGSAGATVAAFTTLATLNGGGFSVPNGNIAAGGIYGFTGCSAYLGQNSAGGLYLYRQDAPTQYHHIYSSSSYLFFYYNDGVSTNTQLAYYDSSGNLTIAGGTATKPGGGSWAGSSDSRLKTAVAPYTASLEAICALKPISYAYNGRAGLPEGRTFYGLAAEDVEPVMPEMIGRYLAKLDPDDAADTELLTVDTTPMIFALVNAVRELKARIEALEVA